MEDRPDPLMTIGELAERTGVPVRTIRFWSDAAVIPQPARAGNGYRRYDAESVARIDLVRTLRELGLDLATVRKVLLRQVTLGDVVRAHVSALDAEIRTLQTRRAVLWAVSQRNGTSEEMRIMNKLAQLSAAERQQLLDDFVAETFAGLPENGMWEVIAGEMRRLPPQPSAEQVEAWIELAELAGDKDFRARVRQMATAPDPGKPNFDHQVVVDLAGQALDAGIEPGSAQGQEILHRIIDPAMPVMQRQETAAKLETFTDRRVERYWQLIGVLNDKPSFGPAVAPFEWLIAALRG
ncbi:MerR family transcriptional regulator [Rhizocola hellebori]|uniref:MerR family transcriptional regulator n=1 Tax=Rhizocola hellebori TaxID=1392758 RepID=A0A8J3VL85_9ACTN|nr:MerR family transcriptional regulator [Rhizocola hellebori]GIH09746.1 MerR family transcriptional regulator [Rhizocola hellebori]